MRTPACSRTPSRSGSPVTRRVARPSAAGGGEMAASSAPPCSPRWGEEALFRGVLYTWLRQRLPASAAIPVSAAAHAAIHGFPAILPLAFILGLGLGWVRERSGSTVPAVIVHVVNNAVLIGWSYYATGWTARLPTWGGP